MISGVWQGQRKNCTEYTLSFCTQLLYVLLGLLVILQNPADGDTEHSSRAVCTLYSAFRDVNAVIIVDTLQYGVT